MGSVRNTYSGDERHVYNSDNRVSISYDRRRRRSVMLRVLLREKIDYWKKKGEGWYTCIGRRLGENERSYSKCPSLEYMMKQAKW